MTNKEIKEISDKDSLSEEERRLTLELLKNKIAGEIALSSSPGQTLKKWRELFNVQQKELAKRMGITPSVISDYESNRRSSPGVKMIHRFVESLVSIDIERGGKVLKQFEALYSSKLEPFIVDIKEFRVPVSIKRFMKVLGAKPAYPFENKDIYGYTIIDSKRAIINFTPQELVKIYGETTDRALIFTNISRGRSPLVAIKVTSLKPGLVVLHGIEKVDDIALAIAKSEKIPLAICYLHLDKIIERLRTFYRKL